MVAVDGLLRATGRLRALDPVLRELVRLRGARHHRCRRCQSVRSVAALVSGATEELLSSDDVLGLDDVDDATRAALRLTDAVLVGRPMVDADLVVEVRAALGPTEAVELVCYLVRNAANKVAVAFGADEAIVEDGHEYQVIADDGDTLTVDAPG
jgi:AhpD family alkylhydroperoxidase